MKRKIIFPFFVALSFSASAQNDYSKIEVKTWPANGSVYMMEAINGFGGGNVALSSGPDGNLVVDNMFVPVMPKLMAAVKSVSDKPLRYVINTHFHGDHIAGNGTLNQPGVTLIAHENGRKRMAANSSTAPNMLPTFTVNGSSSLFFNGEEIKLIHLPNGHTDADLVVYFTSSKVAHMGDMFFFGMFPGVYAQSGGNVKQLVVNLEKVVSEISPESKVIPGHGALTTVNDLKDYISMLRETISIVEEGMKSGKTLDQLTKERVLQKYDALGSGGAQSTDQYLGMLFKLLSPP